MAQPPRSALSTFPPFNHRRPSPTGSSKVPVRLSRCGASLGMAVFSVQVVVVQRHCHVVREEIALAELIVFGDAVRVVGAQSPAIPDAPLDFRARES